MKCELCFDNDCLDLPSLNKIQSEEVYHTFQYIGYVKLESMI